MKNDSLPKIFLLFLITAFSCNNGEKKGTDSADSFRFEEYTITQLQQGYDNSEFTVTDVVQAYLDRIAQIDDEGPVLNAVIRVNPDALTIAAQLDAELRDGKKRGPMHGVPVLLKDNIDTHDQMETTAGSRALTGSHPLQDSY